MKPGYLKLLVFKLLLLASVSLANADNQPMPRTNSDMQLVGYYDFDYLFWDIYQARLYSEDGSFRFAQTAPFKLELLYERSFSSKHFLSETRKQLKQLGVDDENRLDYWLQELGNILVNVAAGDTITLLVDEQQHSLFFYNDNYLGKIEDQDFTSNFAGIWLSERSSVPRMQRSLVNRG